MSYTKGSWKVTKSESKDAFNVIGTVLGGKYKIARCPYYVIEGSDKATISLNEREKKEAEANAKLIAAAPDLLAALLKLKEAIDAAAFQNCVHAIETDEVNMINAAITNAVGT